jgi:hypothetical protein
MKASWILASALIVYGPTCFAAHFIESCDEPACVPLQPTNSYVEQKAVTVAQDNNAQIGDTIELQRHDNPHCEIVSREWTVISLPVLNSTDIDPSEYSICIR